MELPEELMVEILARLPVEALFRCKAVCRSWRSLIEDPEFIADHLDRSSSGRGVPSTGFLIARYYSDTDSKYSVSLLSSDTLDVIRRVDIPTADPYHFVYIIGSSNGVVCLKSGCRISLSNPATGESRLVAEPSAHLSPRVYYGFGYSRSISDHKLVRILARSWGGDMPQSLAHVFTIGDGVWREVPTPNCDVVYKFEGAVAGEVVHWIAQGGGGRGSPDVILSFDLGNDKFGQQPLPDVRDEERGSKRLSVFEESLRLSVLRRDRGLSVWVRCPQGIWTMLARIEPVLGVHRPVGWRAREEILIEDDYGKLVAYEVTTGGVRDICIDGWKKPVYFEFHTYKGSLAPVTR